MGFAVISDHSVNACEANHSSRSKRAGNLFKTTNAIENGVPGIPLRGDRVELSTSVSGAKRTCRADLTMSVDGGRAEVGGTHSNRRD